MNSNDSSDGSSSLEPSPPPEPQDGNNINIRMNGGHTNTKGGVAGHEPSNSNGGHNKLTITLPPTSLAATKYAASTDTRQVCPAIEMLAPARDANISP